MPNCLNESKTMTKMTNKKNTLTDFMSLSAKAQFAFDRGEDKKTTKYLRKAMALGSKHGYFNFQMWRPDVMVPLCMKAMAEGIEVDYVRELIRKRNIFPENPPMDINNWPWPLKIYTLGRLSLFKDGKLIQFSRKVPQKPIALLKALIALGAKDASRVASGAVSESKIRDVLWPDAEGDASYNTLTTNLNRLRQVIGIEKAILFQKGRIELNPRYCWVDIWSFERLLDQAYSTKRDGDKKKHVQLLEKAVEMYHGDFLDGEEEEFWTISPSERLRNKFIRCLSKLGSYREENRQFEKAIDYYNKGIEVYDLAEELYQRLIICYYRIGCNADVVGVYKRLEKVLSAASGITPSQKTKQIFKRLLYK
ncbi:MAG: ATP dependent transcriptional activator [Candidatus Scalindua rubra]|uniref:ATP dependent transcriptional activator n=1 Tax=Candidatus Scalindua rubra TaxID=1872076 RepID=A0A1E3XCQ7_9BACT|nr:MAG: ATP dependent transcriptional activator [Candidatus Scalindua rubra]